MTTCWKSRTHPSLLPHQQSHRCLRVWQVCALFTWSTCRYRATARAKQVPPEIWTLGSTWWKPAWLIRILSHFSPLVRHLARLHVLLQVLTHTAFSSCSSPCGNHAAVPDTKQGPAHVRPKETQGTLSQTDCCISAATCLLVSSKFDEHELAPALAHLASSKKAAKRHEKLAYFTWKKSH